MVLVSSRKEIRNSSMGELVVMHGHYHGSLQFWTYKFVSIETLFLRGTDARRIPLETTVNLWHYASASSIELVQCLPDAKVTQKTEFT